jgi:hypothetical protein
MQKPTEQWTRPSWWQILAVIPWIVGLAFLLAALMEDRAIAKRQQTAIGHVTMHDPANHNRYGYVFSVAGNNYFGWEIPRIERTIGDAVLVYYDPSNPGRNALTDFAEVVEDDKHPALFVAIGTVAIPALIYLRRRQAAAQVQHVS